MNPGRILLAGSSTSHLVELRTALEFHGHTLCEAESIQRVIEEVASARHDALILDSALAGGEPHELCRSIRLRSDLGLLVVDRDGARDLRAIDCLNAGADDYIQEPFV